MATTLKVVFSLMLATFTVNAIVAFNLALKTTLLRLKQISAVMTAMSGGLLKLIAKIVSAIAIFTGLDLILDKVAKSAEAEAKELQKLADMNKVISETYDLVNGKLKENAEVLSEAKKKAQELQEQNKKLAQVMAEIESAFQDAGKSMSDAFADAIVSGGNFKDAMKDIFQTIVKEIISTIVHIMIIKPLIEKLSDSLNDLKDNMNTVGGFGFGNPISAGLGFAGGVATNPTSVGNFANGGFVAPNMPYMVGERGAEMFVPKTAGNIIPNNQMGGGVTINQSLNFSTGVVPTVRTEIMNLMPQIKKETVSAVAEARSRGGTFARTFGA